MTNLTITIPTGAGKVAYFKLQVEKNNFLKLVDKVEEFKTIEDLLKAEKENLFKII
jgi:hypothetical protein|tara:strand:- start:161 stop:328 length:168 start_codon:yes stop_codon:yes gene_type:complete